MVFAKGNGEGGSFLARGDLRVSVCGNAHYYFFIESGGLLFFLFFLYTIREGGTYFNLVLDNDR